MNPCRVQYGPLSTSVNIANAAPTSSSATLSGKPGLTESPLVPTLTIRPRSKPRFRPTPRHAVMCTPTNAAAGAQDSPGNTPEPCRTLDEIVALDDLKREEIRAGQRRVLLVDEVDEVRRSRARAHCRAILLQSPQPPKVQCHQASCRRP